MTACTPSRLRGDIGRRRDSRRIPARELRTGWLYRSARLDGSSQFRDVMRNMLPFERNQRRVHDGIHREMPFAPAQPGGGVVDAAQRRDAQRESVNAELQLLAVSALEDFQVDRHTVEGCNRRTANPTHQGRRSPFTRYRSRVRSLAIRSSGSLPIYARNASDASSRFTTRYWH